MGDFNAVVGSVRSEAIGGVGAETESKNDNRFSEYSICAIDTCVGHGTKTWYGNGTVKAVRNGVIAVTNLCSFLLCRGVEPSESTRVDHRAHAVSFHSSTFHFQTSKKTRIHTRALPKVSRVLCGDAWRQKAFQQSLSCSVPKHIQIDEAYAEMVATIMEGATNVRLFVLPSADHPRGGQAPMHGAHCSQTYKKP